jgi:hypothetical protein
MITCDLRGGLGNQIFQIFTTIAYAIKSKNQFKFLALETLGGGSSTMRNTYWASFFINLQNFLINELPKMHIIREKNFVFNDLSVIDMVNRDVLICGYFQSYKYFEKHYATICKIIGVNKMKETLLNKFYLKEQDLENTVSMHFRIGDYKKIQDVHPIATYEYYENALNYIQTLKPEQKFTIMFFCEDVDIFTVLTNIKHLEQKFPTYKFIRGDNLLADWEQLLFMSCCHYNIIGNSSFSWWSAYFNSWQDKIVCYPSVWFGEAANIDTRDLCPSEWIKINV